MVAVIIIVGILWIGSIIIVSFLNTKWIWGIADQEYIKEYRKTMKFKTYYNTLVSWMKLLENGKSICDCFDSDEKIAVYGMGEIGKLICRELKRGDKRLKYGMDQNAFGYDTDIGLMVYSSDVEVEKVDCFIISMSNMADKIVPVIEDKADRIMTIDEVIANIL